MEITSLLRTLQFPIAPYERAEMQQKLEQHINHLINTDFNRLVQLLYTVDVDEQGMKKLLQQKQDQDAAQLIAALILTRTEEKAHSQQQFSRLPLPGDEERW